jgi:eukaryotic-like serine/threonine-protein kinase
MTASRNSFGIASDIWPRVSTLFDELIDLDDIARHRRLQEIANESKEIGDALAKLLANSGLTQQVSGACALASPFVNALEMAIGDHARMHAIGDEFGAWTLAERIGRGGMGEVWRAQRSDGLYEADAAIKVLRTDLSAQRLALRFERERQTLARLNHPNIARLLDAGIANDHAYLVLELINGLPLLEYVAKHAPNVADRVRLVRDLAHAVEYAHAQLVLHRDLARSNSLISASQPRLIERKRAGRQPISRNSPVAGSRLNTQRPSKSLVNRRLPQAMSTRSASCSFSFVLESARSRRKAVELQQNIQSFTTSRNVHQ